MGCHTWFYKELKKPDLTNFEIKNKIINNIENVTLPFLNKLLKETSDKKEEIELKEEIYLTKIHLKQIIDISLKDEYKLLHAYYDMLDINFTSYNGKFYENTEYQDIFRHRNYEAPTLTSLNDTLEFIKIHNCKGNCYFDKNDKLINEEINFDKLKEFWNKYPNGIIEFG